MFHCHVENNNKPYLEIKKKTIKDKSNIWLYHIDGSDDIHTKKR